jgi:hypothetical protein
MGKALGRDLVEVESVMMTFIGRRNMSILHAMNHVAFTHVRLASLVDQSTVFLKKGFEHEEL